MCNQVKGLREVFCKGMLILTFMEGVPGVNDEKLRLTSRELEKKKEEERLVRERGSCYNRTELVSWTLDTLN